MNAGELLRAARHRHGVTQAQLATRARTSQAAISRIERGLVSPSVATLEALMSLLGERLELASEPLDYGFDRTLHLDRLALSVEGRIRAQAAHARGVRRLQDAIGVEPIFL
jgi:transcriptional regulator with XRE-family HTH domain